MITKLFFKGTIEFWCHSIWTGHRIIYIHNYILMQYNYISNDNWADQSNWAYQFDRANQSLQLSMALDLIRRHRNFRSFALVQYGCLPLLHHTFQDWVNGCSLWGLGLVCIRGFLLETKSGTPSANSRTNCIARSLKIQFMLFLARAALAMWGNRLGT